MNRIKISIFDNLPIIREGLKNIINSQSEFEFVDEFIDFQNIFKKLKSSSIDILIIDFQESSKYGVEIFRKLHNQFMDLKIIVFSTVEREDVIFNALKYGVKGYLTKNSNHNEIVEAINSVFFDKEYFSEPISNIILKSFIKQIKYGEEISEKKPRNLTKREIQILRLVCEGLTNQQIADGLFISIRTVEAHKNNIMQKLELKTTADLVKFGIKNGYVEL